MTLDDLYDKVKEARFPINSRDELIRIVGMTRVKFEGDEFDARDVGLMIHEYPIRSPSHLIELFISSAQEEYCMNKRTARAFRKIEA